MILLIGDFVVLSFYQKQSKIQNDWQNGLEKWLVDEMT